MSTSRTSKRCIRSLNLSSPDSCALQPNGPNSTMRNGADGLKRIDGLMGVGADCAGAGPANPNVPGSFQDGIGFWAIVQTPCVWLLSGCASGTSETARALVEAPLFSNAPRRINPEGNRSNARQKKRVVAPLAIPKAIAGRWGIGRFLCGGGWHPPFAEGYGGQGVTGQGDDLESVRV
jgi:hypothetical protein